MSALNVGRGSDQLVCFFYGLDEFGTRLHSPLCVEGKKGLQPFELLKFVEILLLGISKAILSECRPRLQTAALILLEKPEISQS